MELNSSFREKVVFITGASRGIGLSCAYAFAAKGANIILTNSLDSSKLAKIAEDIRKQHNVCVSSLTYDVSDSKEVENAFKFVFKEYKQLDILVNNAGILNSQLIGMITDEAVDSQIDTNLKGPIFHIRSASRLMSRKKTGSIINITSIMGTNGAEGNAVYSASKAGLIGLTKSCAKELSPVGIRVNAVAPGFIDTDMTASLKTHQHKEKLSSIKMGRVGSPNEVADVCLFLAGGHSTYVTGEIVGVNGGMIV